MNRANSGPTLTRSSSSRNTPVLIPISQITARVNGGKLNVMGSRDRRTEWPPVHSTLMVVTYRSGAGTTGKLGCPAPSSARTAKITLSFDSFIVARVALPTLCACSQSGLVVARQTTSYDVARAPGAASHVNVESFSRSLVSRCTLAGGDGAAANDASVAAFRRATCATYS